MGWSITKCVWGADAVEATHKETESKKGEPDTASDHWQHKPEMKDRSGGKQCLEKSQD